MNTANFYDVIIVGAGAAGMMAAVSAGRLGKKVLMLDKNSRPGRKILITGKGRCNVTNNCDLDTLMENIPQNPRFLYSAFAAMMPADTMAFFEAAGVPLKTERGNRVFPVSDNARDIADALYKEAAKVGAELRQGDVTGLIIDDGVLTGVRCADGSEYAAASVILCCGGCSYPLTGSDGSGFSLAKEAGHTCTAIRPSLIPVVTREKDPKEMMGLSLKNVTLTVTENGREIFTELGEMLFTHFGVSGPLVLSASAHMRKIGKASYKMSIDLKPGLSAEQLDKRLLRDFSQNLNRDMINSLGALLPRKMIPVVLRRAEIPFDTKVRDLTREQRQALLETVKGFSLTPTGFRPVEEAIVTSGGVPVKEVSPKTMESKLMPGLYFAGEMLDVDAYTGGFNLQIAFATGWLAGENC
ncbi:MAG: NAD(P)/FAD-dependent oxidoreductase [Oscillospiraceae bacterium]|nr:NAD(P)/FAD-dependent oxidoreductase [Oscillospiraceae bacterium]